MQSRRLAGAPLFGVVIALLALLVPASPAVTQSSLAFAQTKLIASDAAPYDYFGLSVALTGDTAVVGAYGKSDRASAAGTAYIFMRTGTDWSQRARLGTPSAMAGAYFGASVALNESLVVVGAPYASVAARDAGAVYIFANAAPSWPLQAEILPRDPESLAQFGNALAIDQNTVVVGSPTNDGYGVDAGAVYIFSFDGTTWVQQQKLVATDTAPGDRFGSALALDDGRLAVGAPLHNASGAVYIFSFDGTTWVQQQKLVAADTAPGDRFGSALALDDGRVAVGAPLHNASGAVYIFSFDGTTWVQQQKLVAADTAPGDRFGSALSLDDGRVAIGAPLHNATGDASGAVSIFDLRDSQWVERAKLVGSDTDAGDRLGWAVDLSYGDVIAGAYGDSVSGPASGAAYVFTDVTAQSTPVTPTSTPSPSATPSATPSLTPSATPSVTPSLTPSATPSVTPSATPSLTPSATPIATPPVNGDVRPYVSCIVRRSAASYVALFGYEVRGSTPIRLPVGADNRFTRYQDNLGQPTTFVPGQNQAAFAVVFDGRPLSWKLAGQEVTVSATYPIRCADSRVVPLRPVAACVVQNEDGDYIARFGYRNDNAFNVAIPLLRRNFIMPHPVQRGQPVVFAPGRHDEAVIATFSRGGLVWFLDRHIAVASSAPIQRCRFN